MSESNSPEEAVLEEARPEMIEEATASPTSDQKSSKAAPPGFADQIEVIDRWVHEYPYAAAGVASLLGLAAGYLLPQSKS